MFRSVLAWTLLTAFLVTVPVTGAGHCPCRFVRSLHTSMPASTGGAAVPSQSGKCCCQSLRHDPPERSEGSRPTPPHRPSKPADGPCDCHVEAVVLPGTSGERSGSARGVWDAESPAEAGVEPTSHVEAGPLTTPVEPGRVPVTRPYLRYAHAFRC